MRLNAVIPLALALSIAPAVAQKPVKYHLVKKIPIAAEGGWDYLNIDQHARRLYVSHGNEVDVVDIDTDKVVGIITGMNRSHGIAVAPKFNRGFITSGGNSTVRIFDLKTLATVADLPAAGSPDGILYEPKTERIFAFDHRGGIVTVIDAKDAKVAGTIEIGGMPEFPATDGHGTVWVNQEDKSTLVKIDAASMKVLKTYPDATCEGPTGMDLDRKNRRLFIGCGNEKMAVVNADTGEVITTQPIGVHVDATWFDAGTGLIFNANRSSITVLHQDGKDKYRVVQKVDTEGHANTLAVDFKTHKVYAATSMYKTEPVADGAPAGTKPKDTVIPGTAAILVYAP
jgi:hypothetical protein